MVVVVSTGGTAAATLGLLTNSAAIQGMVGTVASQASLGAATLAANAGAVAVSEAALAAAIAAENAAIAAAATAAGANFWNPAGWIIGAVIVGAGQDAQLGVTWNCYKPIIEEADTDDGHNNPITFANLIAHPRVHHVFVCPDLGSANLPNVTIQNKAGEHYLLQGVSLPWGGSAYHAERVD